MVKTAFDRWVDKAFDYEGRVCEDVPGDAGGPTKYGITISRLATIKGCKLPKRGTDAFETLKDELYALPETEIKAIYKRDYWDAVRGDELPPGVNFAVSDYGLNSGPSRAVKALQAICGNKQTGRMDDETIREAHAFSRVELIMLFCDERERFLNAIVASRPNQRKFLKGWLTRVGDVRRASIALAEKTPEPEPAPQQMPKAVPVEPAAPSVVTEASKSTSAWGLLGTIGGFVADAVFDVGTWAKDRIGDVVEILKSTQTEADDVIAPLISIGEKAQFNLGHVAKWVVIVTLFVVFIRHIQKRVELAHAKNGTTP